MKNKEIEELLNKLKKCRDYDDEVLLIKQYGATLILSYIEQLENNRDKAINHLNIFIGDERLSRYDTLKILMYTKKLLKGDSDE